MKKSFLQSLPYYLVKIFFILLIIAPIVIAFCFSFQSESEIISSKIVWLTKNPTLDNYRWVFKHTNILTYLKNTLIVCVIVISAQIVFSSLAAYAFAFFDFPLKNFLFVVVLMTMMIPSEVTVISNFTKIQQWGLTDTFAGLALPSLISGMSIFLMRQFYLTIPKEIKEASLLDGCSDMRFLFSIAVPLSVPSIASLSIYEFINIYNAYFWPLMVTNADKMRTVQIGVAMLRNPDNPAYGVILAGVVLVTIPGIFVMVFGQEYLIKGMTAGAVKG